MSIGFGQILLLALVGLLLFGNPRERLRDLGKGLRGFAAELKKDDSVSERVRKKDNPRKEELPGFSEPKGSTTSDDKFRR